TRSDQYFQEYPRMKTLGNGLLPTVWMVLLACIPAMAEQPANDRLELMDVFQLEYASDPQVSPDGKQVVYVRNFMDIMKDRQRSHLWIINVDGSGGGVLTAWIVGKTKRFRAAVAAKPVINWYRFSLTTDLYPLEVGYT